MSLILLLVLVSRKKRYSWLSMEIETSQDHYRAPSIILSWLNQLFLSQIVPIVSETIWPVHVKFIFVTPYHIFPLIVPNHFICCPICHCSLFYGFSCGFTFIFWNRIVLQFFKTYLMVLFDTFKSNSLFIRSREVASLLAF